MKMDNNGDILDVSQTSVSDIQHGSFCGQVKIMVVDKNRYSDHILETDLSHVARMVKENFEPSHVNLERNIGGSYRYKVQDTSETILRENLQTEEENLITLLNPAVIDSCSLTISKEEDKDGESGYLYPDMDTMQ